MRRAPSGIRTLTRGLSLFGWNLAVHTVRIAHSLVALVGAALVSWGAAMIYSPAGWITGGAFLLWLANDLSTAAAARTAAAQRAQQGQVP